MGLLITSTQQRVESYEREGVRERESERERDIEGETEEDDIEENREGERGI